MLKRSEAGQPGAESSSEAGERKDPTLNARRLLVWGLSFVLGVAATGLAMLATRIPLDGTLPISFLNIPMLPLAAIPAGLFFVIILDIFMGTRIVPD